MANDFGFGNKVTYYGASGSEQTLGTPVGNQWELVLWHPATMGQRVEIVRFELITVQGAGGRFMVVGQAITSSPAGGSAAKITRADTTDGTSSLDVRDTVSAVAVNGSTYFAALLNPASNNRYVWTPDKAPSGRPIVLRANVAEGFMVVLQTTATMTTVPKFSYSVTWTEEN